MSEDSDRTRDLGQDAYRALGRYVAQFSRLIFHMRFGIERTLTRGLHDTMLASLALGEAPAYNITTSFFAICRHIADLDTEEARIGSKLEEAVLEELKRRNDFAHGAWWIGWTGGGSDDPALWRIKPNRKQGAFQTRDVPVAELDHASDEVASLLGLVAEFGDICLRHGIYAPELGLGYSDIRVRDVFTIEGSRRRGCVIRRPDAPTPVTHYS